MDFRFSKYLPQPECRDNEAICAQLAAFGFPVERHDTDPDCTGLSTTVYTLFLGYEPDGVPRLRRTRDLQVWWQSFVDRVYFVIAHQVRIQYVFDAWAGHHDGLRDMAMRWLANGTGLPIELYFAQKPWLNLRATVAAGVAPHWTGVLAACKPHILFAPSFAAENADIRQQVVRRIALHEQAGLSASLSRASSVERPRERL